jgi:lipoprotein signal peptidase
LINYSYFYWILIIFSIILIFFTYFQKKVTSMNSLESFFDVIFFGALGGLF